MIDELQGIGQFDVAFWIRATLIRPDLNKAHLVGCMPRPHRRAVRSVHRCDRGFVKQMFERLLVKVLNLVVGQGFSRNVIEKLTQHLVFCGSDLCTRAHGCSHGQNKWRVGRSISWFVRENAK